MKKTLVALAAYSAVAAFAQFSVDGIADAGYLSVNYKGNTARGVATNGSSTSQINFRGNEDLGGGLSAQFRIETDWNMVSNNGNAGTGSGTNAKSTADSINSTAGTFGNGELRVGLVSQSAGQIHFGAVNYNTLSTYLTGQPFGTAIGSGFRTFYINDAQATSSVRAENALKYVTPAINGFTGTIYKSNKQSTPTTVAASGTSTTGLNTQPNAFGTAMGAYDQIGTTEFGLNYANGPIAASYSTLKQDFNGIQSVNASLGAAGTAEYTVNTMAGAYTLGAAKLMLLKQDTKTNTSSVDNKATTVSATYTMGSFELQRWS